MARTRKDDFRFDDHGSICTLEPRSRRAQAWVQEFVITNEETQYWGGALVIEPRFAAQVIDGIFGDGLTVAGV